jgi:hypothetical protein
MLKYKFSSGVANPFNSNGKRLKKKEGNNSSTKGCCIVAIPVGLEPYCYAVGLPA